MASEDAVQPFVLYPSQVRLFEGHGYVRGKHFVVYKCLTCLKDMDACACPQLRDEEE